MLGVGIGLENVLALHVKSFERPVHGRVEHIGDAQAWFFVELDPPIRLERRARRIAGNMLIARQFMRKRPHVAGALHIILAA